MRVFWFSVGIVSLALGFVGVLLPLLPTVPFVLLAAFAFARSSPVLHDWLLDHAVFGALIRDWQTKGAIRRPAKYAASISLGCAFLLSVLIGVGPGILVLQVFVLGGAGLFIWTRPE